MIGASSLGKKSVRAANKEFTNAIALDPFPTQTLLGDGIVIVKNIT